MNEWVDAECLRSKQRAEDRWQRSLRNRAVGSLVFSTWFLFAFAWEAGNGWPNENWAFVAALWSVAGLHDLVEDLRKLGVPRW